MRSDARGSTAGKAGTHSLLGVAIGPHTLEQLVDQAIAAIERRGPRCVFACANPHSLVVARRDPAFQCALNDANQVVADGVGVSLAARLLRLDLGPRITGTDYFLSLLRELDERGAGRVFFLGSTEAVLDRIAARFRQDHPRLTLCGTASPPFRALTPDDSAEFIAQIDAARPDVLWIGMTAPKQEKWVHANAAALHVPVIGSIGAVFDFYAGTHPRAPEWMCRAGLEWVYRLVREPSRMWQRTVLSGPRFALEVLRHHVAPQR